MLVRSSDIRVISLRSLEHLFHVQMKLIKGLFIGQEVALPVVDNQVCGAAMGVNEVSK